MQRSAVHFWFRGELISVESPEKTVLRWLREDKGLTGTKEGCAEGDCGACTVAVGTLDAAAPQGLRLRAVNSCLLFVAALDGKALFTVEDVTDGSALHPVQRALVDLHASQCGFCTPGFVMSLWSDYQERDAAPAREEVLSTLAGNLCRCTGYRPIIDAAVAAWRHPVVKLDRGPVVQALRRVSSTELGYTSAGGSWHTPHSMESLVGLVQAYPAARFIAGATDLALSVTKGLKDLGTVISVLKVPELLELRDEGGTLVIGAAVSLTDAFAELRRRFPALAELAERFASPPIRNAGTLGGNVANGSPIGDSIPILLALDASVVLKGRGRRELPLSDFYLGYQKTARQPGEFLAEIRVPILPPNTFFGAWKVSKRRDQDISAVCAAFALTVEAGVIVDVRLGYGGMAAVPSRAAAAERALIDRPWDEAALNRAREALRADFRPLTDGRATADYRMTIAQNLLTRFFHQTHTEAVR